MDLNESKKQRRVSFSDQFFEPANTRNGATKVHCDYFFYRKNNFGDARKK